MFQSILKPFQSITRAVFNIRSRHPLQLKQIMSFPQQLTRVQLGHTDLKVPNFDRYRRGSTKNPQKKNDDTIDIRKTYTHTIGLIGLTVSVYCTKAIILQYVSSMSAAADVLALAKLEVKLSDIPEGKSTTYKWRGKPLFVWHRTAEDISRARAVPLSELRHPQTDEERVKDPNFLVVIGICTHLGCVPIFNAGDYGGFYCPCHGSHFDGAGRARKGPAPVNLEIPPYSFLNDDTIIVG